MIRECTYRDVNELTEIAYQTFDETFRKQNKKQNIDQYLTSTFTKERVLEEIENPNSFFYFIYHKENIAGYLKLNINDAQTENFGENKLEIERIYILNQFQKNGLGKLLYHKALKKSQELLCEDIWLGVWEKNHKAIAFYKKLGFKKMDEHAFYMGDEKQIDYIMMKHL